MAKKNQFGFKESNKNLDSSNNASGITDKIEEYHDAIARISLPNRKKVKKQQYETMLMVYTTLKQRFNDLCCPLGSLGFDVLHTPANCRQTYFSSRG